MGAMNGLRSERASFTAQQMEHTMNSSPRLPSIAAFLTCVCLISISQPTRAGVIGDLVLVLDESGSLSAGEFQAERQFGLDIIDSLTFGPDAAKLGIVGLASSARTISALTDNQSSAANALTNMVQANGGTCVSCGVITATSVLFGAGSRAAVPKIMIVMTDGFQNVNTGALGAAITDALDMNVNIFAIGAGSPILQMTLLTVAGGDMSNVFMINDVDTLIGRIDDILLPAMDPTDPPMGIAEPATIIVFGIGLAGLGLARRRRSPTDRRAALT